MEYRYKVDEKVTTWQRSYITIDAESQEDADKGIIDTVSGRDKWQDVEVDYHEDLYDTVDTITTKENDGNATIEIIRVVSEETIWTNKEI